MKTLSATDAARLISQLRRKAITNMVDAATRAGVNEEDLQSVIAWLDMANDLTPSEIEELRGKPLGEAIANTVLYLQTTDKLTQPEAAGGLMRFTRIVLVLGLPLCGLVVGLEHHTLAGATLAAALGLAAAVMIGSALLGGRPERRYAVSRVLGSHDLWHKVALAEGVGPSPLAGSLAALVP
jgi:hypothetical protein